MCILSAALPVLWALLSIYLRIAPTGPVFLFCSSRGSSAGGPGKGSHPFIRPHPQSATFNRARYFVQKRSLCYHSSPGGSCSRKMSPCGTTECTIAFLELRNCIPIHLRITACSVYWRAKELYERRGLSPYDMCTSLFIHVVGLAYTQEWYSYSRL